jgi:hypothetical protein
LSRERAAGRKVGSVLQAHGPHALLDAPMGDVPVQF